MHRGQCIWAIYRKSREPKVNKVNTERAGSQVWVGQPGRATGRDARLHPGKRFRCMRHVVVNTQGVGVGAGACLPGARSTLVT